MQSDATTPEQYLDELPQERQQPMRRLREVIRDRLPDGFEETMGYGMLAWVVPHSIYPAGYHCNPKLPLPYMNLASQKQYISVYHSGLYGDEDILQWFQQEYAKAVPTRLDMGKCCVRLKKMDQIPYDLIGELAGKMTPAEWIARYESAVKR